MSAEIRIPSILRIGGGSFGDAGALLVQLGCKKPLIVTDPFLMKTQLAERLQKQIEDAGFARKFFTRRWRTRRLM